jgi:NTE family protein
MQCEAASISERLRRSGRSALAWLIESLRCWRGYAAPGAWRSPPGEGRARAVRSLPGTSGHARADAGRPLALALQGGGAHGAFTWGVLERLLEQPEFRIDAISGASAGALNAVALAAGYVEAGPEGARAKLDALWQEVVRAGCLNPLQPTPFERLAFGWNADRAFSHLLFDLFSRLVSPYQANPLGLDPLRDILGRLIDFEALRQPEAIRLFLSATRVESGESRIFTNAELTPDTVLASTCLPILHQAVELEDGHYWDGGFSANPPLLPLVAGSEAADLLIVRVNPKREESLPVTAGEIQARLDRLMFEAPLKRELALLTELRRSFAELDKVESPLARRLAALRLHEIGADEVMRRLGTASRLHPDRRLVAYLRDVGRHEARHWIAASKAAGRGFRPANDNRLHTAV